MNGRARMLFGLAIVIAVCSVGAFFYARIEMESRIRDYGPGVNAIGYARGGAIPSEAEFAESARAAADALGLEVVSLDVVRSEESGRDLGGNLMQKAMGNLGTVRMELVRYDVRTTVIARKWFFSRTGELAVGRTYRREVTLETPNSRPPPTVSDEPAAPRGL
ncbi:MAG: hypothetical protein DRJ42_22405 [Deltaproteobacteria bacterium]|nr:MAG: hypothetical protein DRJ42_22405 [Deltaproteobacteria bacterium]